MTKAKWSQARVEPSQDFYFWVEPPNTACKHGINNGCEECGTTNRRDSLHSTQNGRGAVGRLTKKGKR